MLPSREVPIACIRKRTRSCLRRRRWISAMYSLALALLAPQREDCEVGGGHQSRRLRPSVAARRSSGAAR